MCVRIDQTRHDDLALAIDGLDRIDRRRDVAHRNDPPGPDGHGSSRIRGKVFVHGEHMGVGQQQVTGLTHDLSMRQLEAGGNADEMGRRWPLLLWVGVIVLMVVPWWSFDAQAHWERVKWAPFLTPPVNADDMIANVLLYVPFGYWAFQMDRARRPWVVVGIALLLSLATELAQVYSYGRFPSTTDLSCNVYGAWLGTWHRKSRG
jgi:VanZ family protein